MSSSGAPAIFNSGPAVKAVITLILIENSQEMVSAWDDLRGHYLPTLLGTMRMANPIVPVRFFASFRLPASCILQIPVLWLTTTPAGNDSTSPYSAPPRQYNQLPELRFNLSPDNRITSRIINRAIELMLEAMAPFCGGPYGIHCHMVLRSSQNMRSMIELFLTNLELQGHEQVMPWFPTSADYTFHLSASRSGPESFATPLMEKHTPPVAPRPPVQRHQTFPQDAQRARSETPTLMQVGSTPSLVTSLKKVHGLSRKKLYNTQPSRQPFVREEPVRTKYRHAPTPLSIPMGGQSFPTIEDGHAVGKNKADRSRRADKPSHIGELAGFPTTHPTTSTTFSADMISPGAMPETSFSAAMNPMCDASDRYFPVSPPLQTPLSAVLPVPSQGPAWTPVTKPINSSPVMKSGGSQSTIRRHSLELQHGASLQNLNAMSNKYRLDSTSNEPRSGTRMSQKVKDAGDVPFIFSPELEAATAAKLKAALQSSSTSSQFSAFTSMNHHTTTDGATYTSLSQRSERAVHDACPAPTVTSGGDGQLNHFIGSTSSSLQGWAG
ncbi:hypothetical protein BS17DRAFT_284920 [Gyrodon lividus]|nr:hypothetical protein BS17DRAFT_284920 [Gyrodon lividus]